MTMDLQFARQLSKGESDNDEEEVGVALSQLEIEAMNRRGAHIHLPPSFLQVPGYRKKGGSRQRAPSNPPSNNFSDEELALMLQQSEFRAEVLRFRFLLG